MKKFLIVFILSFSILFTGCSSAPSLTFLPTLAWSRKNQKTEEYTKYKFTRYLGDVENGTIISNEDYSYVEYTLKEGWSMKIENNKIIPVEDMNSTLLQMNFVLTYLDTEEVPEIYRGIAETITSYAVFNRYDLRARFTYRSALVTQLVGDNLTHEMFVDYEGSDSFLGSRQAKFIANKEETILSLKAGNYFDNESVYYLIRSLESLTLNGTMTFDVAIPYQNYADGDKSVKTKNLKQVTAGETKNISVNKEIYDIFYDSSAEELLIPCYETTLVLNEKKSGSDIILNYSSIKTKQITLGASSFESANILMKIQYPTYEKTSSGMTLGYTQVYELIQYNNYNR